MSRICLESQPVAMSRSLCMSSLPPRNDGSVHWSERVWTRWRVARRFGRSVWRRGFSDQCGESEISEMEDLREASFDRRTCHRPVKDLMEREDGRR